MRLVLLLAVAVLVLAVLLPLLAAEGADIIAVDIADGVDAVQRLYPGASEEDLAETRKRVQDLGRRIVAVKADVRDYEALKAALDANRPARP